MTIYLHSSEQDIAIFCSDEWRESFMKQPLTNAVKLTSVSFVY